MIGDGAEPVEVREHLLHIRHHRLDARGDVEHLHRPGFLRQLVGDALDHLVTRVRHGIDRMAEADDDLLRRDTGPDVGLRLVGIGIALLNLEGGLVGAAMLRPAQGADGTGDG